MLHLRLPTRRVEIFDDKDYLKEIKYSKKHQRKRREDDQMSYRSTDEDVRRPRSLVLQKVERDERRGGSPGGRVAAARKHPRRRSR